ncbi:hypothetical protein O6H91_08G107600 [Diphasiastrum complanatum]|uniref:Uncharacterized protein n=1 Tax=Diphasiastrum complanatum TaxID=34168 RepID=A0ACC2D0S1_DIPCM|nr:hypothetical protein O6H91_08G107600 [Diphasiastrum complanatum]
MSAVVCGKRSLFDELHGSPPIAKRLRCSGNSPIRFPSPAPGRSRSSSPNLSETGISLSISALGVQDYFLQLRSLFPEMEEQIVEKVLEACGNNLESAIKSLSDLCLFSASDSRSILHATDQSPISDSEQPSISQSTVLENALSSEAPPTAATERTEWVEHLVQEMLHASDLDDARNRATRALETFEKTLSCRAGIVLEALQKKHMGSCFMSQECYMHMLQENASLKEQLQVMLRDNQILKRAVGIQHEKQLDHAAKSQELQQLKQLLTQYQEQLRTLEINNYALTLHLRKAQEGSSIPGHFHPDVF